MSSYFWLRPFPHRLFGCRGQKASSTRPAVSSRRRARPCLEMLEDRITPNNTFTPTVLTDGVGSGGQIKTLRDAINASNNDGFTVPDHTDTIQLGPGTYTLNQGQLSINAENHNLIIQGQGTTGPNATIIKQAAADRVFLVDDSNGNPEQIIFKDLVIEGGNAQDDSGEGPGIAAGGGILAKSGEVTLSNVVVRSNAARDGAGNAQGGGIYMTKAHVSFNASLTIQNSVIENNTVSGAVAAGGGVFGSGQFNISISNSDVGNNHVNSFSGGSASGGGVFGVGCTISISSSNLFGNVVNGDDIGENVDGGTAAGGGVFGTGCAISIINSQLNGNVVKGGSSLDGTGGFAAGGGVFSKQSSLSISGCDLQNNTLTGGKGNNLSSVSHPGDVGGEATGGGIWATAASVTGCNLSGNILTGGSGTLNNGSASFSGDVGGEAQGGGIFLAGLSSSINTCIVSDNNLTGGNGTLIAGTVKGTVGGSASGGGVYVSTSAGSKPIAISDSTLSGNFVFGGTGFSPTGSPPLPRPSSPGFASGGGASFEAGSTANIINSTIADNQAIGGEIFSNIPVASGGGLFFANSSSGNLTSVTVVGNQANPSPAGQGSTSGGGIDNANLLNGTVTLINTLVALNGANLGPDYNGTVGFNSHDLISVADDSSGFSTLNGDLLGSESNFLNPHLGQLGNNGGSLVGQSGSQQVVPTIALLVGSPAINAGVGNGGLVTGKFDQRGQGFARVVFGDIDIGAFEVQLPKVSPPLVVKPPPPPSPTAPPTLHTPSLLAFFDGLLGGIETVNSNDTETVIDSIFGIPLLVATYNSAGNLLSVTLFGIDVTFLFESL